MKVKINKVVPLAQFPASKNPPIIVDEQKYVVAPTTLQQNYTGFPVSIYFCLIPPEANCDYEYIKVEIKVLNSEFRNTIINLKQEVFKAIKRPNLQRSVIFEFIPMIRGSYQITVDCSYRQQFFVQGSQPPPEKRDTHSLKLKCEQPFQVKQYVMSEDIANSTTFPLFIQYSIESKLFGGDLICDVEFTSDKFKFKELHNQKKIKLKKQEIYYLVYEVEPKLIQDVINEKGITVGTMSMRYGTKGQFEKKTMLKTTNKYVLFKATTKTKQVPKKDIVQVEVVFSKIYNVNLKLGNLKLLIDEKQMPQVKILKTSIDRINLDQNKVVNVIFTVICLKSGQVHLKGLTLRSVDDVHVYFVNDLILNVGIEPDRKASAIMENTSEVFVVESLL